MPSLVSLAEELLAHARKVEEALKQNDIPNTSFGKDTLELLPDESQKLRWDLLDLSHSFRQLLRGARLSGLDVAYSWTDQVVLRIIWRYKLASAIPTERSATYDEISAACGLSRSVVVRTIRAAIPMHIFDESSPGHVCHTAISKLLAENEGYYNSIGLQLEDLGPSGLKLIEAWEEYADDAGEPDQSAFSLYNGGQSLFTVLAREPDRAHRFDSAMKFAVEDKEFNFFHVVKAFDWSTLDKPGSRLVDVGGGQGQISQAIAKHTQHLAFSVQDLSHVVDQGSASLPSEFTGRIVFETHDFKEPQSSQNPPDAYLISRCLHNWSDYHSANILRNLVPGLKAGCKILIWDSVLDDRPVKKLSEKFNLQQDFIMATIFNGKDRSVEEFRQLLKFSDERFRIKNVCRPEGCKLSMIEVSWDC